MESYFLFSILYWADIGCECHCPHSPFVFTMNHSHLQYISLYPALSKPQWSFSAHQKYCPFVLTNTFLLVHPIMSWPFINFTGSELTRTKTKQISRTFNVMWLAWVSFIVSIYLRFTKSTLWSKDLDRLLLKIYLWEISGSKYLIYTINFNSCFHFELKIKVTTQYIRSSYGMR